VRGLIDGSVAKIVSSRGTSPVRAAPDQDRSHRCCGVSVVSSHGLPRVRLLYLYPSEVRPLMRRCSSSHHRSVLRPLAATPTHAAAR
jgi:hypothetical protein